MAESMNVTVFSQNFSTAQKAQARANIGAASANEGNSAILEWDGTSRLYDQIEELVDAGQIVFIKKSQYYYTPLEGLPSGRFCFVSMPTSYVVFYLEFYPSGHPTGFSETTQVNATIKYFNSNDSDETIWTGTSGNSRSLNVYEDTNKERYISGGFVNNTITFYNMNPDSQTLAYAFTISGTSPNYTYSHTVIKAQQYPTVTHVPTSSEYRTTKAVRVAIARLDNFAQTAENTPKAAEFEIICSTGDTTPNGNPNSSFSMHVLVFAKQNGGPIKVDCNITGNNGWDMEGAMPTISAYDTNNSNGVIIFFGLMNSGVWQDFEQTYVTVVNMKPDVTTLATVDSVKSYADPVWHPDTASSGLPSYTVNEAGESLVVNGNGNGVEWSRRISGGLYNGSNSEEMRRIRINTYNNPNTPGLVAAFPASGQGVFCGTLMPEPDGIDKVARVIDNPNNPGISMLAYQDDAAVISPLDKYTITTSTNPYEVDVQPGKWYEIVCSQSTTQTWHIYLEANSTVTTNTVHTIVRITRTDASVSCSPELVWHDERGIRHYEQCDLTGATSYYDFDCLVRKNGYTAGGQPWSFARVRRL